MADNQGLPYSRVLVGCIMWLWFIRILTRACELSQQRFLGFWLSTLVDIQVGSPALRELCAFVFGDVGPMPQTFHYVVYIHKNLANAGVLVGWWQLTAGALVIVGFKGDERCLMQHVDSVGQLSHDCVQFPVVYGWDIRVFREQHHAFVRV